MNITKRQLTRIKTACDVLCRDMGDDVILYDTFLASTVIKALESILMRRGIVHEYQDKLQEEDGRDRIQYVEKARRFQ